MKKFKNFRLERKARELQEKIDNYNRDTPSFDKGLTSEQVKDRVENGLTNKRKKNVTKSWGKMIYDNFFTFFNVLLYIFAVLVIIAGKYNQLLFLGVIMANSVIGFIQDVRARQLVQKLSIVNNMKVTVVRDGNESEVNVNDIVLDDIILLKNGDQIPADCIIVKGKCSVNEAMLTGEPDSIKKKARDEIYAGTYVSSGSCYARVNCLSILNRAEQIQSKASTFSKPNSEILRSLTILFRFVGILIIIIAILSVGAIYYCWIINLDSSFSAMQGTMTGYIDGMPDILKDSNLTSNIIGALANGSKETIPYQESWLKDFWTFFADPYGFKFDPPVTRFVGSMVSMIPAGMFLLTSVTLSVGVITLAKKRCLVQDLYSIEMLARIDTLCLDKTGTITDGTMSVSDYLKLDKTYDGNKIKPIISSLLAATKDNNFTAEALKAKYGDEAVHSAKTVLPFSSETKCSAATFDKIGTFALGAFGFIRISNKEETQKIIQKYSAKGYRCLIICHSKDKIEKEKLPKTMECVGVILLEDHIRDDAPEILTWFAENNVDIKVISGDDPVTVSEIAKKAGIKNSNLYINLEGKSIEEVKKIASQYTIFGRVSPDQKEALVIALKDAGKTVAMTGDGVNDILALKRADCSIAMASGSDAAKNVSNLVLLDSNFSVLTSVVAEGRRVINNIQRTSSLFLTKTFTSILISIVSLIAMFATAKIELQFPLSVNNFYIWESAFIGIGGFFLALEPNSKKIEGGFLNNALRKAIPAGICISLVIFSFYLLYIVDYYKIVTYEGIEPLYSVLTGQTYSVVVKDKLLDVIGRAFKASCAIGMTFFGCVAYIRVCYPFSKYRGIVVGTISTLTIIVLVVAFKISMPNEDLSLETFGGSFFGFEFTWMTQMSWLWVAVFTLVAIDLYYISDRYLANSKFIKNLSYRKKKAIEG